MHKHRTKTTSRERCYSGPTDSTRSNPRAHGGVEWTEVCACGAERRVLSNASTVELGRWYATHTEEESR